MLAAVISWVWQVLAKKPLWLNERHLSNPRSVLIGRDYCMYSWKSQGVCNTAKKNLKCCCFFVSTKWIEKWLLKLMINNEEKMLIQMNGCFPCVLSFFFYFFFYKYNVLTTFCCVKSCWNCDYLLFVFCIICFFHNLKYKNSNHHSAWDSFFCRLYYFAFKGFFFFLCKAIYL